MAGLAQAVKWHRQAAALALAADRVGVGTDQLPAIQARLTAQREALAAAGSPAPELIPSATEVSAAMPSLGDLSTEAVAAAFQSLAGALDAADAALAPSGADPTAPSPVSASGGTDQVSVPAPPTTAPAPAPAPDSQIPPPPGQVRGLPKPPPPAPGVPPPWSTVPAPTVPPGTRDITGWAPGARNAMVYGGYSLSVLVVQIVLLATLDEERTLPLLSPFCLIVLPAMAWLASWLTIGAAFRPPPGEPRVKRTPRLGILICLLPNFALCAFLGALFVIR